MVLAGSLRHGWGDRALMRAGDVGVLRAGTGLVHDEAAGDDGARVLQCYLRPADPASPPSHEVHHAVAGPVDLRRADAALRVVRAAPGEAVELPAGLLLQAGRRTTATRHEGGPVVASEHVALVLWQLETGRPAWALEQP